MVILPEMRPIPKVASLMLVASLVLPMTALAKRIPAPVIEPIVHEPFDKRVRDFVCPDCTDAYRAYWKERGGH